MNQYPHVTVATVVSRDNGDYLMVVERDGSNTVVNQPAGHLEINESLTQAAIRETLEETAWQISLTGFLGVNQYYAKTNDTTYIRLSFTAKPISHCPEAVLDDGIITAEWMSADVIRKLPNLRSPMVMQDIENHQAGRVLPLEYVRTINYVNSL